MEIITMRNTRIIPNVKMALACVPSAGAATTMTAVAVDGTGFNRCAFVVQTGAAAAGATLDLKITQSETTGGSYTDITSAALTQLAAASGASKVFVIDVPVLSTKPFFKISGSVGTDTFANSVMAILYRNVETPIATTYATQYVVV
jgi:hypothetical protein